MKYLGTVIWFIIKSTICGLILRYAILTANVPLAIAAMAFALWIGWRQHAIVIKKEQNKSLLDLDKLERLEKILKDSKQENKNDKGE